MPEAKGNLIYTSLTVGPVADSLGSSSRLTSHGSSSAPRN
jgi:hypothetical protein